jgi:7 transmembrane receptor (rhodopsin family)
MMPDSVSPEVLSSGHNDGVIASGSAKSCCERVSSNATIHRDDYNDSITDLMFPSPAADIIIEANTTTTYIDELAQFEAAVAVVVPVIFGLIAVLGFIGNLLVIVVVATSNRKRRSTTNILVSGLAVADLVFIIVCVPFTAVAYALGVWPFGTILCMVSSINNSYIIFIWRETERADSAIQLCDVTSLTARNVALHTVHR